MPTITKPFDFAEDSDAESDQVNDNFDTLYTWVNTNGIHKDGTNAFTAIPSGPASDPSGANQFTRKAYVDMPSYVATTTGSMAATHTPASINMSWTVYRNYLMTEEADGCTVQRDGFYIVGLNVIYNTNVGGGSRRNCALKVNAGSLIAVGTGDPETQLTSGFGLGVNAITTLELQAGDRIQCLYAHDVVPSEGMTVRFWAHGIPGTISA